MNRKNKAKNLGKYVNCTFSAFPVSEPVFISLGTTLFWSIFRQIETVYSTYIRRIPLKQLNKI